jgi:FkbM family methyltransferase
MLSLIKPGFYCLDIGANCGYYSLIMADAVGESGHVLAVEPNPRLSNLVTKSLNVNGFSERAKVSEKAVSDTIKEKVQLVIPEGEFWGSATLFGDFDLTKTQSFEVETITIDELTKDYPRVDFIKIDAEGAEEAIWEGMQQTIEKNRNIIIIMEFACYRKYDPKVFLEDIKSKGFSIQYIDNDSQIKSLSIDECMSSRVGAYWDLILWRKN